MGDLEERAAFVDELRRRHGSAVLTAGLNLPRGCPPDPSLAVVFRELERELGRVRVALQPCTRWPGEFRLAGVLPPTAEPRRVKRLVMAVERRHPLGRLFDLDVTAADGRRLSGEDEGRGLRACFLCPRPALECRRLRRHEPGAVVDHVLLLCRAWAARRGQASRLADLVSEAAVAAAGLEAVCWPKPGLVDRRGPGVHDDMDLPLLVESAACLGPWFRRIALVACRRSLRGLAEPSAAFRRLRGLGRQAEAAMFRRTGGVNTHKGLLFSLGLLCAAAGSRAGRGLPLEPSGICEEAAAMAAGLVESELAGLTDEGARTAGQRNWLRHEVPGARGEAAAGFPTVRTVGLPALERSGKAGEGLAAALVEILAVVDDGNVLARGGVEAAAEVRRLAAAVRDGGGPGSAAGAPAMEALEAYCRSRRLSPGGAADLLACSIFLRRVGCLPCPDPRPLVS